MAKLRPLFELFTVVVAAISLVVGLAPEASAYSPANYTIVVAGDGTVEAIVEAQVEPGLNAIPLPAEPLMETVYVEFNGKPIPPLVVNMTAYIAVEETGTAILRYVVNVTAVDNYLEFTVKPTGASVTLVVEPGIVLLSIPRNITGYRLVDGKLYINFTGESTIRYVVVRRETVTPPLPPPATETTTATPTPAETARVGPPWPSPPAVTPAPAAETPTATTPVTEQPPYLIVGVAGAIAAAALAVLLASRGRGGVGGSGSQVEVSMQALDETDKLILNKIAEHGGEVLQSQLQRELGLPKTTLWRRLHKLESMGYVRIVREGRVNRVILLKKP